MTGLAKSRDVFHPPAVPPLTSCCDGKQRRTVRGPTIHAQSTGGLTDAMHVQAESVGSCCSETCVRDTHGSLPPCKSLRSRHRRIRKTNSPTSSARHRQPGRAVSAACEHLSLKNVRVGARSADSAEFMNHSVTRRGHRQSTCVSQAGAAAVINNRQQEGRNGEKAGSEPVMSAKK